MTARIVMKLVVAERISNTSDIDILTLRHPSRPTLPRWEAGAHVDLRLPSGKIRQYSLCGDPSDSSTYRIAVKREPEGRGGSTWIHENLRQGSLAHVSHPRTNFRLREGASRHILIAGGVGVTPLAAMARTAAARGEPFELHLCSRSRESAPLLGELDTVCGKNLHLYISGERRLDMNRLAADAASTPGTHIYSCGPQRLTDELRAASEAAGFPQDCLHFELFQATLDENYKPEPFDVTIASTKQRFRVPSERSILHVLRDEGFILPASCELGVCGSCECGYRDGTIIHRDSVLDVSARQDRLMLCVSRARVHVTLDL